MAKEEWKLWAFCAYVADFYLSNLFEDGASQLHPISRLLFGGGGEYEIFLIHPNHIDTHWFNHAILIL